MIVEYIASLPKKLARKILKKELESTDRTVKELSRMVGSLTQQKILTEKKFGGAYALIMFANMFPEIFEKDYTEFTFKCSPPLESAMLNPAIEPIKFIEYKINTHEGMYIEEAVKLLLERGLSKEQILTSLYTFGYHFEREDLWWDMWIERFKNEQNS